MLRFVTFVIAEVAFSSFLEGSLPKLGPLHYFLLVLDGNPEDLSIEENLKTVGRYQTASQANDDTLLILSMGIAYWMLPVEDGFEVKVEASLAKEVVQQLERSRAENKFWPPRLYDEWLRMDGGSLNEPVRFLGFAVFAIILGATFFAQSKWGNAFTDSGGLQVERIVNDFQWWRTVTALTLHADIGHLLGNLGLGSFFAIFVVQIFGSRLGWSLILLGGVFGCLANTLLHWNENFSAIGASTSVFAAVGLIAGSALMSRVRERQFFKGKDSVIPVFVSLVILAWWGSSGQNTDTMGHLMGLVSGVVLGFLFQGFKKRIPHWIKTAVSLVMGCLMVLSWWLAIQFG